MQKRRPMSAVVDEGGHVVLLNHDKCFASEPLAKLEDDEVDLVVQDLLQGEPQRWDLELDGLTVAEAKGWFGEDYQPEVHGWKTRRLDIFGTADIMVKRKGNRIEQRSFESYFGRPMPPTAIPPEARERWDEIPSTHTGGFGNPQSKVLEDDEDDIFCGFDDEDEEEIAFGNGRQASEEDNHLMVVKNSTQVRPRPGAGDIGPMPEVRRPVQDPGQYLSAAQADKTASWKKKQGTTSIWLASGMPITLEDFLPVLQVFSSQHAAVDKLRMLLAQDIVRKHTSRENRMLPVRASFPVFIGLRFGVSITKLDRSTPAASLFEIPSNYTSVGRKEAHKIDSKSGSHKRFLLANVAL